MTQLGTSPGSSSPWWATPYITSKTHTSSPLSSKTSLSSQMNIMASFDVVSLFTSVPISDATTIAKDRLAADLFPLAGQILRTVSWNLHGISYIPGSG